MRLTQKIASTFKRFTKAESGTTAIIFAISLVPILAAAGAAIDFVSFYNTHNHMQAALDAGSLAGATASGASTAQRIKIATDTFNANMNANDLANGTIKVDFKPNAKTVEGTASLVMPTTLMSLVGINLMDVGTHSEVSIPADKNAEIAFVLDYSWSMTEVAGSQVKYVAMRDAVTKLVNNLTAANASKLKFAVVPFSDQVFTDIPNPFVLGQFGPGMWTGCTLDNPSPYN
jgi:Flp pilus assembly protein TadG